MKRVVLTILLGLWWTPLTAQVRLPDSLELAGPLATSSEFGDEFYNFPAIFGGRAAPGHTHLSGWLRVHFSPPTGNTAEFTVTFDSVGTDDAVAFPGGPSYVLTGNKAFNNPDLVSRGRLNLETGEVERIEIHALFQNSVIAKVTKNVRIPFGFINDYPPAALPVSLPFTDEPTVLTDARFSTDTEGRIVGFAFHGVTIAPVTLFPQLGLFPPFSFADGFYFANPDGCAPGAPAENCPTDENNPDGIHLPRQAFFHPHLDLVVDALSASTSDVQSMPCLPVRLAGSNGLQSVAGKIYYLAGDPDPTKSSSVQIYSPSENVWSEGPLPPVEVWFAQSATVGSRIYLMGGIERESGAMSARVQIFDTGTGAWSEGAPMSSAVEGGGATVLGGEIYVLGGSRLEPDGDTLQALDQVQIYSPVEDRWRLGSPLPVPTTLGSAVTVGSEIYFINGQRSLHEITDTVWIYSPVEDAWSAGPSTLHGVFGAVAGYLDGRIYLVGGRAETLGETLDDVQILDVELGVWRPGPAAPVPSSEGVAAVMDDRLYVAGGRIMVGSDTLPGEALDTVQTWDPGSGWSVCDSHPIFDSARVVSAAGGRVAPADLAPGARAVILGHHLAETSATAPLLTVAGNVSADLPTQLQGVQVLVDGQPAPLLSVAPKRIDFQVPYGTSTEPEESRKVALQVLRGGSQTQGAPVWISVSAVAPSLFVYDYGELLNPGYLDRATIIARNSDGRVNYPLQPAEPGEIISLLATGLGVVQPTLQVGERAEDGPYEVPAVPRVWIGGIEAAVVDVRLVPREIGLYEVQVKIPEDSPRANNVLVEMMVGGISANRGSISVRDR